MEFRKIKEEPALVGLLATLFIISYISLNSISPFVFPLYFFYYAAAILIFVVFTKIDFDILRLFSVHLYVISLGALIVTLLVGQITRGAVRWIQIGPITLQSTELIRPFIILFFADYLSKDKLTLKKVTTAFILLALPLLLILFQPSLGVSVMTFLGFCGVLLTLKFNKKIIAIVAAAGILSAPLIWLLLAPYQKLRVLTMIDPSADPGGAGYNSIQSKIAVGSGQLFGRGLGEGIQTQLAFLPERHTDFIFASIAEEMGFLGTTITILVVLFLLFRILSIMENASNPAARAYVSGVFVTLFFQTIIHVGMNMGLFPITGLPLPIVSAGGSSLIATVIMLGIVVNVKRTKSL